MNIRKLKAKLVEKDISIIQFANILGIDRSTVYRKLNKSGGEFYCKRCWKIAKALSLTYDDINNIFYQYSRIICDTKKSNKNETGKVKCPKCNVEILDGNLYGHCGLK